MKVAAEEVVDTNELVVCDDDQLASVDEEGVVCDADEDCDEVEIELVVAAATCCVSTVPWMIISPTSNTPHPMPS